MIGNPPLYDQFRNKIISESLPELIECIKSNYGISLSLEDLDLSFDASRSGTRAYGTKKIAFGEIRAQYIPSKPGWVRGGEYLMFKNDLDLWTHDIFGWRFVAWWLPAHELAHTITNIFKDICKDIPEPIIPNTLNKISAMNKSKAIRIGDFPLLENLLQHQAYWIRQGSIEEGRINTISSVYDQNIYTISGFNSNTVIFWHGVFFQHINRTLRRQVVNPKFNIPVNNWKQKAKPKRKTRVRMKYGRYRNRYYLPEPQMY
jgi:hypothetical protein